MRLIGLESYNVQYSGVYMLHYIEKNREKLLYQISISLGNYYASVSERFHLLFYGIGNKPEYLTIKLMIYIFNLINWKQ